MKRIVTICLIFAMILSLSSCCLQHEWEDADCITPKTCSKCGKTEGEPLGHSWEDATCTKPKKCKICGETDGEPLGHTPGDWEVIEEPAPGFTGVRIRHCTVCGQQVEREEMDALPIVGDGVFQLAPYWFYFMLSNNISDDLMIGEAYNPLNNAYGVVVGDEDKDVIFRIWFLSTDNPANFNSEAYYKEKDKENGGYNTIMISFNKHHSFDANEFVEALKAVVDVLAQDISESEKYDIIDRLVDIMSAEYERDSKTYQLSKDSVSKNGLCYRFGILITGESIVIQPEK